MPEINTPIQFSADIKSIIEAKLSQQGFAYTNWSDDDLEPVRVAIRTYYRTQQNGICAYCRNKVSLTSALNCHVEHVVPKSKHIDFIFTPKNLCVICADCNQIKREQESLNSAPETVKRPSKVKRYPQSANAFLIVHPHFDIYHEHIVETNGYYFDITMKGHFTIGACRLNRRLHEFGWEAPIVDNRLVSEAAQRFLDEHDPLKRNFNLSELKKLLILVD